MAFYESSSFLPLILAVLVIATLVVGVPLYFSARRYATADSGTTTTTASKRRWNESPYSESQEYGLYEPVDYDISRLAREYNLPYDVVEAKAVKVCSGYRVSVVEKARVVIYESPDDGKLEKSFDSHTSDELLDASLYVKLQKAYIRR
jgi:hypothetical protein